MIEFQNIERGLKQVSPTLHLMFIYSVETFRVSLQYVLHTALGAIDSSHVKWSAVIMISNNKLTREIT